MYFFNRVFSNIFHILEFIAFKNTYRCICWKDLRRIHKSSTPLLQLQLGPLHVVEVVQLLQPLGELRMEWLQKEQQLCHHKVVEALLFGQVEGQ